MIRRLLRILAAIAVLAVTAAPAGATPMIYTFEAPNFTAGQVTPLLSRAPNVNPGTFLTDFTSSPIAGGLNIQPFVANPLFSGQSLFNAAGVLSDLLLTFNTPVFQLQVDFAMNLAPGGPPGLFRLSTPVGVLNVPGGNVGGVFQGGTLVFGSATPFLTARFSAFNAAGAPVEFAIDDLTLDTAAVPEPATIGLVLSGLALAARRRRKS